MSGDGLGDRMKRYEAVAGGTLMRRAPVIVRVDGKAFHTLTRGMDRPFDQGFVRCMEEAATALLEEAQGSRLAYCQSDEISVVLCDYDTIQTEPWFGYRVQKVASVAASIATAAFTAQFRHSFPDRSARPVFDGRVFSLPDETEIVNYLIWRQQDATRNSIQATGYAHFSAKQLHKVNTKAMQEMLFTEKGINWNDTPTHLKRGLCAVRETYLHEGAERAHVVIDHEIPVFSQDRGYVLSRLPGKVEERALPPEQQNTEAGQP